MSKYWNADDWHLYLSQLLDARANFPNGLNAAALKIADTMDEVRAAHPPQVDSGREDVTIPLEFIRNCGCPSDRRMTVGECTDRGTCGCSLALRQQGK